MGLIHKTLLYPSSSIERTAPVNITESHKHLFAHEYKRKFDDCFAYTYRRAYVSGSGLAFHRDKVILRTIPHCLSIEQMSELINVKSFFQYVLARTEARIPKGLLITDEQSHGFFHWIVDVLPKLLTLDSSHLSEYTILIPEKFYSEVAKNSLKMIGVDISQVYIIPYKKKVLVDSLFIIGCITLPAGTGNYRPETIQTIRSLLTSCISKITPRFQTLIARYGRKIYVTRNDANYRLLSNEDEIYPLLKEEGFKRVFASELSFEEQVMLFSHAHIILGLHGAGLTNMMWMAANSVVAEIRHEHDDHNNCYFALAAALQHKYFYSLALGDSSDPHYANLTWSKNSARALLRQLHNV